MAPPGDPARRRRPGHLRVRNLRVLAVIGLLVLLAGACTPSRDGSRSLLALAEAADGAAVCPGGDAGGDAPPGAPRRVTRGHSLRSAVVTCSGVGLRLPLEGRSGATLDLALGRVGGGEEDAGGDPEAAGDAPAAPAGPPSTAVLELRRGGGVTTLLEAPVPAEGWREHRVEVPPAGLFARGRAELVLRSAGGAPVAWAGLFLHRGAPSDRRDAERPPSLVLVSLDTVRADHLSLYGYDRPTTPRLERFARQADVFTRAYSSSSWTLPSTATLLTGLLPGQHGARTVHTRLGPDVPTLAERLQAAGYRTAAVTDGGFAGFRWGFDRGFQRYDVTPGAAWHAAAKDAAGIFGSAADWVRRNRHEPFFLFVHTYEAHQPYLNREGFADPFLRPGERGRAWRVRANPRKEPPDPEGLRRMVALYDGEIARADHYLGELLDVLAEELGGRVAVVVTSDHGEEFLEHGDLEHGFGKVFDPNVRVPLVVKAPGATAGRRVDVPVGGIDVAPTLLELAGLAHGDLPGRSLLGLLGLAGGPGEAGGGGGDDGRPCTPPGPAPPRRSLPGERPVLVHGLPSFPELAGGERLRLHREGASLILDRMRPAQEDVLLAYEPGSERVEPVLPRGDDAGTGPPPGSGSGGERRPPSARGPSAGEGIESRQTRQIVQRRARRLGPRLGSILAWLHSDGFFVRLPDDARRLALPGGGRIRPRGVWSGDRWRDWPEGAAGLDLGEPPHLLAFGLEEGRGGWEVLLARTPDGGPAAEGAGEAGAAAVPYRLTAERRPPWDPFVDPLPPPGVVLPGAVGHRAGNARIDDATARELRALGYLQ